MCAAPRVASSERTGFIDHFLSLCRWVRSVGVPGGVETHGRSPPKQLCPAYGFGGARVMRSRRDARVRPPAAIPVTGACRAHRACLRNPLCSWLCCSCSPLIHQIRLLRSRCPTHRFHPSPKKNLSTTIRKCHTLQHAFDDTHQSLSPGVTLLPRHRQYCHKAEHRGDSNQIMLPSKKL